MKVGDFLSKPTLRKKSVHSRYMLMLATEICDTSPCWQFLE